MTEGDTTKRHVIDVGKLPLHYPTNHMPTEFWEVLGRAVATFGFLEEVLGKAIYAFTATRLYDDEATLLAEFDKWNAALERALSDQLGALIDSYAKAVKGRTGQDTYESELIDDLKKAAKLRNILCHGSWRMPDEAGRSIPFFVTKKLEICETPVDVEFLKATQRAVAELSCCVINTVSATGLQFPGSGGPGKVIGG